MSLATGISGSHPLRGRRKAHETKALEHSRSLQNNWQFAAAHQSLKRAESHTSIYPPARTSRRHPCPSFGMLCTLARHDMKKPHVAHASRRNTLSVDPPTPPVFPQFHRARRALSASTSLGLICSPRDVTCPAAIGRRVQGCRSDVLCCT
jgi:hypothetical protein